MILIAAGWILVLLAGGGVARDPVLVCAAPPNFGDRQAHVRAYLLVVAGVELPGEGRV